MFNRIAILLIVIVPILKLAYAADNKSMNPDINGLFNKPSSALFFEYVGVVKKPIYPIFMSSSEPNLRKINNVFKYCFGEIGIIQRFIVSEKDLNEIIAKIKNKLPAENESPKGHFMLVDVGIVKNGRLIKRILSIKRASEILAVVHYETKGKYEELNSVVINFNKRISPKIN